MLFAVRCGVLCPQSRNADAKDDEEIRKNDSVLPISYNKGFLFQGDV